MCEYVSGKEVRVGVGWGWGWGHQFASIASFMLSFREPGGKKSCSFEGPLEGGVVVVYVRTALQRSISVIYGPSLGGEYSVCHCENSSRAPRCGKRLDMQFEVHVPVGSSF